MWNLIELEILEQFGYKCIRCQREAVTLHEIIPKSRTKNWGVPENRVPLCAECHNWAHKRGASNSAEELRELRRLRLAKRSIS